MLVHDPHDLGRVHGGAAAQGDDHIRLKGPHLLGALLGAGQGGIRLHVEEAGVGDAHLIQLVGDGLGKAILIEEGVRYQEGTALAHNRLEFVQGHRQAALLDIDLSRNPEPKHIFPPCSDGFDVQKVLDAHVVGNAVSAPRAAAQGQGGGQLEVVQVADAALGGGGVHQDTAGFHPGGEILELILLGDGV